jgi:hypothetical protein
MKTKKESKKKKKKKNEDVWLFCTKFCCSLKTDTDEEGGKSESKKNDSKKTRVGHNIWPGMQNKKEKEKKEHLDEEKLM